MESTDDGCFPLLVKKYPPRVRSVGGYFFL